MNGNSHRWFIGLAALSLLVSAPPTRADNAPELAKIKIAAEAGDPAAQFKLAERFVMRMDSTQADFWYRKSAEQGYAQAQGKLGNILLRRCRTTFGATPEEQAALGEEAFKWLTLGANQGDPQAQGDLASVFLEGKLVGQDLVTAYKWGALAAKGPSLNLGTITGKSALNAAILKMTPAQIAEGDQQVAAFKPRLIAPPKPAAKPLPPGLILKGISGTPGRRFALINTKTFAKGDTQNIKLADRTLSVRCVEIRDASALITVQGYDGSHELKLK